MVSINTNCLIILCNILLQVVHSQAYWHYNKNNHFALADAAVIITQKYLSNYANTIVITERSIDDETQGVNKNILEHILLNLRSSIAVQLYNVHSENQPWEYHVFVVDSAEAFDEIRWGFPQTLFERDFRFLIILTRFTAQYLRTLNTIFTSCRRFHVVHANIILHHPSLGVSMFKYNLFTEKSCHLVQPYLYFRFEDNLNSLRTVYSHNLLNFYGCPLRVTARVNKPFLTFSGNNSSQGHEENWKSLSGLDGELIKLLAKNLNFTIDLLPFPKGRSYFINFTGFGCFADLLEGRADIAAGGFSASDPKGLVLTPSAVYHMTPLLFIIRGRREQDPIHRLATPFEGKVWLTLTLFLLASVAMIRRLRHLSPAVQAFIVGRQKGSPMTNFFAVLLGYPITHLPQRNFARYLLLVWLLMSLVLRNAYQGSLFDSIRMDRFSRLPEGFNDLQKWGYKIIVSKYFDDSQTFQLNETISVEGGPNSRLIQLEQSRGRYATVALRENFMSYMEKNFRNGSKLIMINEPVFTYSAVMFFSKHSIHASTINRYLRLFNDAGITANLAKRTVRDANVFQNQKKGCVQLVPITTFRLLGVFEIWGGLLLIAFVIFVLELLSVKWKKLEVFINSMS